MATKSAKVAVFLQNACYDHQYIRSKDTSLVVERPERLRAVTVGLAATLARLEEVVPAPAVEKIFKRDIDADLAEALGQININSEAVSSQNNQTITVIHSSVAVDLTNNAAVKFVHGDIEGDKYLENLISWIKESRTRIASGQSEIPEGLSQGDLYLCPGSLNAIQGSLGTVCEAVDTVVRSSNSAGTSNVSRAFAAVRPPGHHCGEDTPSGFCFVNNVAVGAAHAHLKHGINRIVIFDIDLHHGNGTQSIVWQINEETYRKILESEAGAPNKPGPQIFYGSMHDILSYPCEDGKPELVQAASVSIHGNHGQYIENVHLEEYTSEDHFWNDLYPNQYKRLFSKAKAFLDKTGGPGEDIMVFISCGFDACEHEYTSMSRHNRKVPTSFYYRFTREACAFSDHYARGRLVSVLEGGYSDRALTSGTMAHLFGLTDVSVNGGWWNTENLEQLEKATKKRRGGRPSLSTPMEPWLTRAMTRFSALEAEVPKASRNSARNAAPIPPSSMQLRERKPLSTPSSPKPPSAAKGNGKSPSNAAEVITQPTHADDEDSSSALSTAESEASDVPPAKKLPKVILRLGPKPEGNS